MMSAQTSVTPDCGRGVAQEGPRSDAERRCRATAEQHEDDDPPTSVVVAWMAVWC